jgi:hypothetical protein
MTQGDLWHRMHVQPRRAPASLTGKDIPTRRPGVYAWYREGEPVYSGRATGANGLHGRIWKNHLKTGDDLSRSSFRRNVCEHLAIAPTSTTTVRPTLMTAADIEPVTDGFESARWRGSSVSLRPRPRHLRRHYTPSGCRPSLEGDGSRTRNRPATGAICRTHPRPVECRSRGGAGGSRARGSPYEAVLEAGVPAHEFRQPVDALNGAPPHRSRAPQ